MEELPDRLRITDNIFTNNTHLVGMVPVERDVTIMAEQITYNYVPGMGWRVRGGGEKYKRDNGG